MGRDVDRLLAAIPIESYIGRFVTLKRKGSNLWGLSPWTNEKTPSFSVSPEKNIFKDFSSGKGGNLVSFVMEYEGVDFLSALKILSDYSGIPLENRPGDKKKHDRRDALKETSNRVKKLYRSKLAGSPALQYLETRGVSTEMVEHFSLGYAPADYRFLESMFQQRFSSMPETQQRELENCRQLGLIGVNDDGRTYNRFRDRLMFPIHDLSGGCIGFGGRIITERDNTAKYMNSPDSELFRKKDNLFHLYEARDAIRKNKQVILVEGYFDVLGLVMQGLDNTVAPLGTAFTPEQARLIKRYTDRLLVFFDNDRAGIEAAFKSMQIARAAGLNCRIVSGSGEDSSDPFDLARRMNRIDFYGFIDNARNELEFTLWYFFIYKYNTKEINGKKSAITAFFEYLRSFKTEWEKNEYIRAAAEILGLDERLLYKDFTGTESQAVASQPVRKSAPEPERGDEFSRIEKQILTLLLQNPDLWSKESLLKDIAWQSRSAYLLYAFFRDRFKSGEFWQWDELESVVSILPAELGAHLSGLLIEFENTSDEPEDSDFRLEETFNVLVLRTVLADIEKRLSDLQQQLKTEERLRNSEAADSVMLDISLLLKEKKRISTYINDLIYKT